MYEEIFASVLPFVRTSAISGRLRHSPATTFAVSCLRGVRKRVRKSTWTNLDGETQRGFRLRRPTRRRGGGRCCRVTRANRDDRGNGGGGRNRNNVINSTFARGGYDRFYVSAYQELISASRAVVRAKRERAVTPSPPRA